MPGEQEHHICLYRFSFHKPIKSRLARGRLYLPLTTYKSTTESATLRQLKLRLFKQIFEELPNRTKDISKEITNRCHDSG